ncbi:hypothetical protein [Limnospira maxima]|uniref:hypothetical protein n=1 Tax=Limnospira maxima TaxID=129910 RepID=UPI001F2F8548|nr:hypothetical protein [Limnospira maxima]
MKVGLWIHQGSPIPWKAHGRRSQSLFRTGFGNTSTTRTQTMPWQRNAQRPSEQRKNQPTPYTNY